MKNIRPFCGMGACESCVREKGVGCGPNGEAYVDVEDEGGAGEPMEWYCGADCCKLTVKESDFIRKSKVTIQSRFLISLYPSYSKLISRTEPIMAIIYVAP